MSLRSSVSWCKKPHRKQKFETIDVSSQKRRRKTGNLILSRLLPTPHWSSLLPRTANCISDPNSPHGRYSAVHIPPTLVPKTERASALNLLLVASVSCLSVSSSDLGCWSLLYRNVPRCSLAALTQPLVDFCLLLFHGGVWRPCSQWRSSFPPWDLSGH